MRIPAEGVALYPVEGNRSEIKGATAVSKLAALGAGFPDALPRQRPARGKTPDVKPESRQRSQSDPQGDAEGQPQADRRKEKQRVLIDLRAKRPLDLANGTVIDVKI
jgi:hypothetical protein